MAVVIETTLGDITVDLYLNQRPVTCLNFLKLCKMKYYNFNLFHTIRSGFIAQTGDPTGEGSGGESIFGLLEGPQKRFFSGETMPKIRHTDTGLLSMVCTGDMMVGSQFFFTLGTDLDSLDGVHCVIGEVAEGHEVLRKLNEVICDESHRPYQDVRITHTVILEDPFSDPKGLRAPSRSPSPSAERLKGGRIAPDDEIDEAQGKSAAEVQEMIEEKEAKARATILEIIGDIPDADIAPPENVLFVCKLNPVTTDEDLEIIFSRFGKIVSCEVIRDKKTGDSLQYAFIEFADKKSCEDAYFKMDNVLIDDRRIHVDFSQSVSKIKWLGKGRGVKHIGDERKNNKQVQEYTRKPSNNRDQERDDRRDYRERHSDRKEKRHDENKEREKYNDRKHRDEHTSSKSRSRRERSRSRSKLENSTANRSESNSKERYSRHSDKDIHFNDRNKSYSYPENNDNDRRKHRHRSPKRNDSPVRDERSGSREKNRFRSPKPKVSPVRYEISDSHDRIRRKSPISQRDESPNNRKRSQVSPKASQVEDEISDSKEKNRFRSPKPKASPIRDETSKDREKNRRRERSNSSQNVPENRKSGKGEPNQSIDNGTSKRQEERHSRNANSHEKHKSKKQSYNEDENHKEQKKKHDADDRKSKSKRNRVEPETPPKEQKEKKDKTKKVKVEKAVSKNKKVKKRKPSTSSDSDSSESSSSSSTESSSSSDSDSRRKKLKRRKRKHSTSSSSSSSESSSSSSSSDSSTSTSSSSDSEPSKRNRKKTKNNKKVVKKSRKK